MIINGFGGGAANDLGLTIPRGGTTLWSNGTSSTGYTLSPSMEVTTNSYLSSGSVFKPKDLLAYNNAIAMFVNLIWFVPIRGKTISFDFVCTNYTGSGSPMSALWVGILSNVQASPYPGSYYSAPLFIYWEAQTLSAANTKYTGSFTVPNWAVMGYLGFAGMRYTGYYVFDNIRISS